MVSTKYQIGDVVKYQFDKRPVVYNRVRAVHISNIDGLTTVLYSMEDMTMVRESDIKALYVEQEIE